MVLALLSGCVGDDTSTPPRPRAPSVDGGRSEVLSAGSDGGGTGLPSIDLSELDADAISQLEGVYLFKTINGYRIACWEDGRVQVQTPRGEMCSKNVGVIGRVADVKVQSRGSSDETRIVIHGVEVVRRGACAP